MPTLALDTPEIPQAIEAAPVAAEVPAAVESHASIGESVLRGALALLSTQPLTWGVSLLAAAFVPRLLGAEALGQYTMATAIAAIAGTAFGFGIPDYLVRRIAQHPNSERTDVGRGLLLHTLAGVVAALGVALFAPLVVSSSIDLPLLYIVLITIIAAPAQAELLASLRGREKHTWYAWANASQGVVITVGGVLALMAGADVRIYAIVSIGLTVISTFVIWRLTRFSPKLPRIDRVLWRDCMTIMRGGFPFYVWNLTLLAYAMVDNVLLGYFVPVSEIGLYTAALRVVGVTVFIPTLIVTPLFPALSRSAHEPNVLRRALSQALRLSLIFTVPLAAGISALAPAIPSVLGWPDEFSGAVPLVMVLSIHLPAVAVDMVFGTLIMAVGRAAQWTKVGLIATVFNVGLNLVGIPLFEHTMGSGAMGASVVKVSTEVLMLVAAIIIVPNRVLDPKIALLAIRVVVAGIATGLVASFVLPVGVIAAIAAGGVTYVVALVVLRGVELEDARYVQRRFSRHRREV
jgi:O-antigen/teichoic acid export membrane protein